jgi:YspA, cpYpsA-related SLOG family
MRILVCGGRDYADARALNEALDALHREKTMTRLIHGGARGADSLAAFWAITRGIPVLLFPADWRNHGKSAGFLRNARMLREGRPDLVAAFPGGKGTAHMVKLAREAGVPVLEITGQPADRKGGRP